MPTKKSFADQMKTHQVHWALGQKWRHKLEARTDNQPSWVLREDDKESNLYKKEWWGYIEGKEHKWARALNSSQCFAINLFAPLADDRKLAMVVMGSILPHRICGHDDEVRVQFEHTPPGAPDWLGEKKTRQPTQVDVFFTLSRSGLPIGYLLVEVKFAESEFGSCRGAAPRKRNRPGNPDPSRCLNLSAVRANPVQQCWMVEKKENGRLYWDFMKPPNTPFDFSSLLPDAPCPFRYSLYQLMRNQVLAIALKRKKKAEWADFGICIHPGNDKVRHLKDAVAGERDAIKAFERLLGDKEIVKIDPRELVQTIAAEDNNLSEWKHWMTERYQL